LVRKAISLKRCTNASKRYFKDEKTSGIKITYFRITDLETMYLPGWRPASFNYWGTAAPR